MLYVRTWDGEARIPLFTPWMPPQWQYETGREVFPPAASNGSVYVPGWDSVVALEPKTGRPKWLVGRFLVRDSSTDGILYGTGRLNDSYTIFAVRSD